FVVWFRKNKAKHDLFDDSRRDQCLKYKHKQPPQIPAETENSEKFVQNGLTSENQANKMRLLEVPFITVAF
ncbi:MAG: hypothetical protein LBI05_03910, partial [Planctomycetaceae bacterium]|nr:hypothetical protein [Planctomycetaceae bacterium]